MSDSGNFEPRGKESAITISELLKNSRWIKARAEGWSGGSGDQHVDKAVYNSTIEETAVEKQWLRGPFTANELDRIHGDLWIAARRFGVVQGDKIRNVDDFSECMVNAATELVEKVSSAGIDEVVLLARAWLNA
eukprot:11573429-Karenia_brevis.AAC.1